MRSLIVVVEACGVTSPALWFVDRRRTETASTQTPARLARTTSTVTVIPKPLVPVIRSPCRWTMKVRSGKSEDFVKVSHWEQRRPKAAGIRCDVSAVRYRRGRRRGGLCGAGRPPPRCFTTSGGGPRSRRFVGSRSGGGTRSRSRWCRCSPRPRRARWSHFASGCFACGCTWLLGLLRRRCRGR